MANFASQSNRMRQGFFLSPKDYQKTYGKASPWMPQPAVQAPDQSQAIMTGNQQTQQDQMRRRQSSTLFTSGQGVLDSPLIASALLLGS